MPISIKSALLFAAASTSPMIASETEQRPVRLVSQTTDRGVTFQVVGSSTEPTKLVYSLVVEGGSGGNTVRQSGRATTVPGKEHVLTTVSISARDYDARLVVEYDAGGGYETVLTSPKR